MKTLGDLAPNFFTPAAVVSAAADVSTNNHTGNPTPSPARARQARLWIIPFPARAEGIAACQRAPVYLSHNAEPGPIRDRNDALERLRCIRRWFESSEPSSPTIPLLRRAEDWWETVLGVINEIGGLLEKWDAG